jgi:hypothetical protein
MPIGQWWRALLFSDGFGTTDIPVDGFICSGSHTGIRWIAERFRALRYSRQHGDNQDRRSDV